MSYGPPPGGYPPPPAGYGPPPGGAPPSNWLVPSILATIFCCLPFGIVGIVFAAQVNDKWNTGDYAGAQDSADKAKKWTLASVISVPVLFVVVFGAASAILAVTGEL
ncbi:TRAP-type mannitol/chloroaromatic compound transport system permease small subunit [Nocardiopsis mwathae]|uniref:TRAP-type mannitol/chloroaromatic compound transport system permease small subunit n=1 Tax=Nocardiopsis mwathae TaxID=1472723 RepID=A0A7W9YHS6_9ACTN|nr:CD225/dispanin family protein [Nocardiopsis mwathae]MBB6172377.1 TRAP-type mannitol/chloroaromatic compound transport system permease small subunit [Nocardiopsis mwathae]